MMDLFLTNPQFSRQKALLDELKSCGLFVDYSDVFNQLFVLTVPIHYRRTHWWASDVKLNFSKKLIYILDGLIVSKVSANSFLGELLF